MGFFSSLSIVSFLAFVFFPSYFVTLFLVFYSHINIHMLFKLLFVFPFLLYGVLYFFNFFSSFCVYCPYSRCFMMFEIILYILTYIFAMSSLSFYVDLREWYLYTLQFLIFFLHILVLLFIYWSPLSFMIVPYGIFSYYSLVLYRFRFSSVFFRYVMFYSELLTYWCRLLLVKNVY